MALRLPKNLASTENRNSFHSHRFTGDPIISYFFSNSTQALEKKEKTRSSQNFSSFKQKRSQILNRHSTICTDHTWSNHFLDYFVIFNFKYNFFLV
jgi:hypothetical protein